MDWTNRRRDEQRTYLISRHQQWTLYGWLAERNFLCALAIALAKVSKDAPWTANRMSHLYTTHGAGLDPLQCSSEVDSWREMNEMAYSATAAFTRVRAVVAVADEYPECKLITERVCSNGRPYPGPRMSDSAGESESARAKAGPLCDKNYAGYLLHMSFHGRIL